MVVSNKAKRLPTICAVKALPRTRKVNITWSNGRSTLIDLRAFINYFKTLVPLDNYANFKRVAVGEDGHEITWGGDMSIAASTLRRLVIEQSQVL